MGNLTEAEPLTWSGAEPLTWARAGPRAGGAGRGRTSAAPTRGRRGLPPQLLLTRSPRRPERLESRPRRGHFRDRSRLRGGPGVSVVLRCPLSPRVAAGLRGVKDGDQESFSSRRSGSGLSPKGTKGLRGKQSWAGVGESAGEETEAGTGGPAYSR